MKKMRIGVIGCGKIAPIYMEAPRRLPLIEITACCDLDEAAARARSKEYGIPRVCSLDEIIADPEIDLVLNITHPDAHAEIAIAAIEAGKHVYNEKPLALNRKEGQKILDAARTKGVRVGCAPDTFLGGGLQTCRKLIDDGEIGEPVAATAFMAGHGHESWHPNPDFYYQPGAGPLFDMGPYYLTALVHLISPVRRVSSSARITFPERIITSEPLRGRVIKVNTPTHVAGTLDFANGAIVTLITSFDIWGHTLPCIEIYGSEGTLRVPDPNTFGGPVFIKKARDPEWIETPPAFPYVRNSRGLGVSEMAAAIRDNRPHRASGDLAFHVLDVMQAIMESSETGRHITIGSDCPRPQPLPLDVFSGK